MCSTQCVIYDSDAKDARLIGIEYVVDEKVRFPFSLCPASLTLRRSSNLSLEKRKNIGTLTSTKLKVVCFILGSVPLTIM